MVGGEEARRIARGRFDVLHIDTDRVFHAGIRFAGMRQRIRRYPVGDRNRSLHIIMIRFVRDHVFLRFREEYLKGRGVLRIHIRSGKARLVGILFVCAKDKIRAELDARQITDHIARYVTRIRSARIAGQFFDGRVSVDDIDRILQVVIKTLNQLAAITIRVQIGNDELLVHVDTLHEIQRRFCSQVIG